MHSSRQDLHDVRRLAEKLFREFGFLPFEQFAEDRRKVESAVMGLLVLKEGWVWLQDEVRGMLLPIDWQAITGRWDRKTGRHVGVDDKVLWETIVEKLPDMSRKAEELLKKGLA